MFLFCSSENQANQTANVIKAPIEVCIFPYEILIEPTVVNTYTGAVDNYSTSMTIFFILSQKHD